MRQEYSNNDEELQLTYEVARPELKDLGRYLDLTSDYAFKLVFGNADNKQLLIDLINSFLPDRKIVKLEYADREIEGLTTDNKAIRLDLHCTDEKNREFIVEIQKKSRRNFYQRTLYYASLLYDHNLDRGDISYDSLKPVYLIAFLCEPLKEPEFKELNDVVLWYQMCEKNYKCFAPDGINIIFANIWKAAERLEDCQSETEQWCQIIRDLAKYSSSPETIGNGKFEDLARASEIAAYDRDRLLNYKKSIMTENDWKAIVKESYEDGLEQGIEQGIAQGITQGVERGIKQGIEQGVKSTSIAIAKAMLLDNVPIENIVVYTGLSLAEIRSL